jgi:hypothetical protein
MVQATVDRIDAGIAVLILEGGKRERIVLPAALLPKGCREGDILSLILEPDTRETGRGREQVASQIERLKKR